VAPPDSDSIDLTDGAIPSDANRRLLRRDLLLAVAVFVVALGVLGWEARVAPFEADEADYTATSRYFGYLFLQRDPWRSEWDGNHWTRTQPPLTRYVVGGWLTLRGFNLEALNQPYVSTASSFEVNRRKGRVPTDDVLAAAREPMVVLGAGAVAGLFALGALLGGTLAGGSGMGGAVAGLAAAALALSSGFVRYTLVHAWAEAPLACFLLLAALLVAVGAGRLARGRPWLVWALAGGAAMGLASATKLTGLVGPAATLGIAVVGAWLAWRTPPQPLPETGRGMLPSPSRGGVGGGVSWLAWAATSSIVATVVFVGLNPFLWRGPIAGLSEMLAQRRDEMAEQQEQWPEFAVLSWAERPGLAVVGATRFGPWDGQPWVAVPVGLALLVAGGIGLIQAARRRSERAGSVPSIVVATWQAAYLAAIVGGLGLSYPRYFMPACLFALPLAGVGVAWIAELARARLAGRAHTAARTARSLSAPATLGPR